MKDQVDHLIEGIIEDDRCRSAAGFVVHAYGLPGIDTGDVLNGTCERLLDALQRKPKLAQVLTGTDRHRYVRTCIFNWARSEGRHRAARPDYGESRIPIERADVADKAMSQPDKLVEARDLVAVVDGKLPEAAQFVLDYGLGRTDPQAYAKDNAISPRTVRRRFSDGVALLRAAIQNSLGREASEDPLLAFRNAVEILRHHHAA